MKQTSEGEPSPITQSLQNLGIPAPKLYEEIGVEPAAITIDTSNDSLSRAPNMAVAQISEGSRENVVVHHIPSSPPHRSIWSPTPDPAYEEIKVWQATKNTSPCSNASNFAAAYTFSRCLAYGQVPQHTRAEGGADLVPPLPLHTATQPQYEEIREVQASRNTFTQCPAYGQVPQHTRAEDAMDLPSSPLPPCISPFEPASPQVHEYEYI